MKYILETKRLKCLVSYYAIHSKSNKNIQFQSHSLNQPSKAKKITEFQSQVFYSKT